MTFAPEKEAVSDDETFPELLELQKSQRHRHRRLVLMLFAAGACMIAVGGVSLQFATSPNRLLVGAMLITFGVLSVARAFWSYFTDHDTRDRGEWDALQ